MRNKQQHPDSYYQVKLLAELIKEVEKAHIGKVLKDTGGNLQQTSRLLGIARNTLKQRIKEYNLGD